MSYPLNALIEPALVVGPHDDVLGLPESRGDAAGEGVFVVVHRRFGTFTHVYRTRVCRRSGRTEVHLLRVLAGERLLEARAWARERFPARPPRAAAPVLWIAAE